MDKILFLVVIMSTIGLYLMFVYKNGYFYNILSCFFFFKEGIYVFLYIYVNKYFKMNNI